MSEKRSDQEKAVADERKPLFAEFTAPSYEEWHAAAVDSLKGKPFESLLSETAEGITLRPLYRQEDAADLPYTDTLPGQFPFLRGTKSAGYLENPWLIAQEIHAGTPPQFNAALRHDLARGQTAVNLLLDRPTRDGRDPNEAEPGVVGRQGVSLATVDDVAAAFRDVDLHETPLFVRSGTAALPVLALIAAYLRQHGGAAGLRGSSEADPLGELARRGELPLPLSQAYDEIAALIAWTAEHAPHLDVITVHSYPYRDSGGHVVQELAFTLATGVAYLRAMQARDVDVDTAASHMQFAFSLGGDYFMEIAKLRAARVLWAQTVKAFGGNETAQKMVLHGRTARWNKTLTDAFVNMLRVTTEAFSGALGGVDSMHAAPFDEEATTPDEFSRRIARNVQIILQEEANLTRLIDPAGGSWYVEYLTDEVAKRAWALFQEVEAQGGMLAALEAGFPQEQVAATAAARAQKLATRRDVLVGTNMYPNLGEERPSPDETDYEALYRERAERVGTFRDQYDASEEIQVLQQAGGLSTVAAAIDAAAAGATLGEIARAVRHATAAQPRPTVRALEAQRAGEPFEQLRLAAAVYQERHGHRPRIFLANMGPLRQHKARADFTQGFFAVGGFEVIYPEGFDTPEAAAVAAAESGATAVVICSTDDTYPELVPPLVSELKARRPDAVVILAGYPKEQIDAHKTAGVDAFIHLGADCLATNQWLQEKIVQKGIER